MRSARAVPATAAADCVLFLWATAPMIADALVVMRRGASSTSRRSCGTRRSPGPATGFGISTSFCWSARAATCRRPRQGTQWPSVIRALRGAHSGKPERALELIEDYFPTLPKIELYGRGEARLGWDAWGNEVLPQTPRRPSGRTETTRKGQAASTRSAPRDQDDRPQAAPALTDRKPPTPSTCYRGGGGWQRCDGPQRKTTVGQRSVESLESSDQIQKGARRSQDLHGHGSIDRRTVQADRSQGLPSVLAPWRRAGDSAPQDAPKAENEAYAWTD